MQKRSQITAATAKPKLAPSFTQSLKRDGFTRVGHFEIREGNICFLSFENEEAASWTFCVYSWVSFADGGKHIRIGKSEPLLRSRLIQWKRHLGDALNITLPRNQQFDGGTPPWEARGWLKFTVPYKRSGLLYAQRVKATGTLEENKKALKKREKELQLKYNPPLCNDISAGKHLKELWIAEHGTPQTVRKRALSITGVIGG